MNSHSFISNFWRMLALGCLILLLGRDELTTASAQSGPYLLTNQLAGDELAGAIVHQDIGSVGVAGASAYANGVYTISGSGVDIWNSADGFQFAYVLVNGDWEIVARVTDVQYTDPWAKAGVMMRESLEPTSRHAFMALTPQYGVSFQRRVIAATNSEKTDVIATAPAWVKLVRNGSLFAGYRSTNGVDWEHVGTVQIEMGAQILVGLAVTAHNNGLLCAGSFDNVSVSPRPEGVIGQGDGLSAIYFDDLGFMGSNVTRVDPIVNFDWGTGAPVPVMGVDTFSARWTGELEAQHTGKYTFSLITDDGGRLYINEQLVIDAWYDRLPTENSASVTLEAGQKYLVRLEYYEDGGGTKVTLGWSSADTPKQVIPQSQLYSQVTDNDHDGMPDIWERIHGLNPSDPSDATLDPDGDGVSNLDEYWNGTNPQATDTDPMSVDADGDGLPDRWQQVDVGATGVPGHAFESNGVFSVTGSGTDMWGQYDEQHYVYAQVNGDWQIVTRVVGLQNSDGWARAGIIVREGLSTGGRFALAALTPAHGIIFQRRLSTWGNCLLTDGGSATAPVWLKVTRRGNLFTALRSADGMNWQQIGSQQIQMPTNCYFGLFVSSHTNAATTTAIFESVNLVQTPVPVVGTGDGLQATYYDNDNLTSPQFSCVDTNVDFNWGNGAPFPVMGVDTFSARWVGELQAQYTEPYTLRFVTDDGVRVWLNGQLLINNWVTQAPTESAATVQLVAGQKYLLVVEYFDNQGGAIARLQWSSPSTVKQAIPQSQLYSQLRDSDGDGMPDVWELAYGLNPANPNDAMGDLDGDGVTNLQEYLYRTDPRNTDTDGDSLSDYWLDQDIGSVEAVGGANYNNGVFSVAGAGKDIWDQSDAFHYVYHPISGDFQIVARVTSQGNTDPWAKAGVMARANLNADSPNVLVALSPGHGGHYQCRSVAGAYSTRSTMEDGASAPMWVKLVREGNVFSGYVSSNSLNWVWVDSTRVEMPNEILVGLAVTAHKAGVLSTATFDQVSIGPANTPCPALLGTGDGLAGSYYPNRFLDGNPALKRVDGVLDFTWGTSAPLDVPEGDNFGVAWLGELQPQFTERYTFHLITDDGVRVWINDRLIIDDWYIRPVAESTASVDLIAGQRYLIRIEYFENTGDASVRFLWSSPSTCLRVVPQSQLYSHFTDIDQDGMADLWEAAHGLNPADPSDAGLDLDGDGLSNLQEFVYHSDPRNQDTDADGMPDAWEVLKGFNPGNSGDASEDADKDGLKNLQEFLAGTDPSNQDTDADGLSDWMEMEETQTNPLVSDISELRNIAEVPGMTIGSNYLGRWATNAQAIYSIDSRGYVEYTLTVTEADTFRLEVEGRENDSNLTSIPFDLLLSVDGEYLGRVTLVYTNSANGFAYVLTPWLQPGNHTVRVFFDNALDGRSLRIEAVRLQEMVGIDTDGNGVKDWVQNRLRILNGVEMGGPILYSATSPMCLEGRGRYLSMASIKTGLLDLPGDGNRWFADMPRPWITNYVEFTQAVYQPLPAAGSRWYTDIPLLANKVTAVEVSFQNDGVRETNRIVWRPTNLLQANDMTVRQGDSLLFAVEPLDPKGGGTDARIEIVGITNCLTKVKEPMAYCFSQPGTYTIMGAFLPGGNKPSQTNVIQIKVVGGFFAETPVALVGKVRTWDCPDLPAEVVVQGDARLWLTLGAALTNGRQFRMVIDAAEPRQLIARIATNGPIFASARVEGFQVFSTSQTFCRQEQVYPDGSQLVAVGVVQSPLMPQVSLQMDVFVGGVIFEDGTVSKTLAVQDFNALGQATVRLIRPASAQTSVCHHMNVFQGPQSIGQPY